MAKFKVFARALLCAVILFLAALGQYQPPQGAESLSRHLASPWNAAIYDTQANNR